MRPIGSPPESSPRTRRWAALGVLALVLLTCTGCNTEDLPNLAFPDPATEEAPRMLLLWQGSWLAAILTGAVVWGLILWACIFHRKKHADDIPIQTRYNLPIEALYTILPFVMVVVLFYFTERDQSILMDEDRQEDLTVNVVGRQWSWSFNYVDENVYVAGTPRHEPELVLPVNKLVRFEVTAADVIHSFWVPNFLFKIDAVPGRTNSFEATPNKLGTFSGKCAELCGRDHARMYFTVRVVSEEEYAAHIAELRRNGQEGQLPRGILDTPEDRERAYNLKQTYNTHSDHSSHGAPATEDTEAEGTEPAQSEGTQDTEETESEPAQRETTQDTEETESEPANDAPATPAANATPSSDEAGNSSEGTS